MKIKVYLNESRDSFRGFDYKNARLREAAEFDLDAELPRLNLSEAGSLEAFEAFQKTKEAAAIAVLEGIFTQLNVGGDLYPAEDYTVAYREAGNRSLSVGDVVTLDGAAYAVGRFGWDKVLAAGVSLSVRRYERLGEEVLW